MTIHLPPLAPALVEDTQRATPRALTQAATQAAHGVLADPTDAAAFLDLEDYLLRDGSVNHRGLSAAVADLARGKPYLAARPSIFTR